MKCLAISCSTKLGSIAICEDDNILYSKSWSRSRSHGEIVTPAIEEGLKISGLKLTDFDFLALDIGPGSFTGIRVAVNSIKTLAYASNLKVICYDSLKLISENIPVLDKPLYCVLNAFKNEIFLAEFEVGKSKWKTSKKPKTIAIEDFNKMITKKHYILGEFELAMAELNKTKKEKLISLKNQEQFPSAVRLAKLAIREYKSDKALDWKKIKSLYLKASAAEEKLKSGLLKPLPKL